MTSLVCAQASRASGLTLSPRLARASEMLESVIASLDSAHTAESRALGRGAPRGAAGRLCAIMAAREAAGAIAARLRPARGVAALASELPVAVSVLRSCGSALRGAHPDSCAPLAELSALLGGIAVDSAIIAGARVDYAACGRASSAALGAAARRAESKLSKQYPKLDRADSPPPWR